MQLFCYENIRALKSSELKVYDYVITHMKDVSEMSIRQLGRETGVSTTTILRFCEKVGCEGYQELKFLLHQMLDPSGKEQWSPLHNWKNIFLYLEEAVEDKQNINQLELASDLLASAKAIHFLGVGTSGSLATYGSRYFANLGLPMVAVLDPFFPKATYDLTGTVLVALSVSGETEQVLTQVEGYKIHNAKVISITDTRECRLAQLSDYSLAYYIPQVFPPSEYGPHNLTSQLPVVFYLEKLAHMSHEKLK